MAQGSASQWRSFTGKSALYHTSQISILPHPFQHHPLEGPPHLHLHQHCFVKSLVIQDPPTDLQLVDPTSTFAGNYQVMKN